MIPLVLTFVGDDRPGLVNAISETIAAHGGTWLESRSAELAGKFAGILLASVPDASLADLELSLRHLERSGLRVTIERGVPEAAKPFRPCDRRRRDCSDRRRRIHPAPCAWRHARGR